MGCFICLTFITICCLTLSLDTNDRQIDNNVTNNKYNENSKQVSNEGKHEKGSDLYEKALLLLNSSQTKAKKAYVLLLKAAKLNHKESRLLVAKSHLFADYLPFNSRKALKYLNDIPINQSSNTHLLLGFMYSLGLGVNISPNKSLFHYTLAANLDNSLAKMAIGFKSLYGIGVQKSCEKALDIYHTVAARVVQHSEEFGGNVIQTNHLWDEKEAQNNENIDKDLINYFQFLAKRGDINARVSLGGIYYFGTKGVKRNIRRALTYFESAAKTGNTNAFAFLGSIYSVDRHSVLRNYSKAKTLFELSSEKGNPFGETGLGLLYRFGRGVDIDFEKAFRYFILSSRKGYAEALIQLGLMYLNGLGVSRDYRIAYKYLFLASQSKHLIAYYNLGQLYASGRGVSKSCPIAVNYFKSVAERGIWSKSLTEAYNEFQNQRYFQSFMKYAFLSEFGYECSQSNAAFLIENHVMDVKDINRKNRYRLALKYWLLSSIQGMSFSRLKVGDYYYYGIRGTGVDYQLAADYYRRASEYRYSAQGLFNLGYLHERGLGVEKSSKMALMYYEMSSQIDPNGKLPVLLMKIKLSFIETIEPIVKKWDLVLIFVLLISLCFCVYLKFNYI